MVIPHHDAIRALVVIGTSTGGPKALTQLFSDFRAIDGVACCIVQHMPPGFTANLAKRLDDISEWNVREGRDDELIKEKHAYIAPGGMQMRVFTRSNKEIRLCIQKEEPVMGHQPSVNVLFESAVAIGAVLPLVGVLLTGMGKDGATGLAHIRKCGGFTVAESEETAVIYGMPKAAVELGAAIDVVPLTDIANLIERELA